MKKEINIKIAEDLARFMALALVPSHQLPCLAGDDNSNTLEEEGIRHYIYYKSKALKENIRTFNMDAIQAYLGTLEVIPQDKRIFPDEWIQAMRVYFNRSFSGTMRLPSNKRISVGIDDYLKIADGFEDYLKMHSEIPGLLDRFGNTTIPFGVFMTYGKKNIEETFARQGIKVIVRLKYKDFIPSAMECKRVLVKLDPGRCWLPIFPTVVIEKEVK